MLKRVNIITGSLGAALLTICQLRGDIDKHIDINPIFYKIFLFLGIALLLVTAIAFVFENVIKKYKKNEPIISYRYEIVSEAELPNIHEFIMHQLKNIASLERWIDRYKVNTEIVFKVLEIKKFRFKVTKSLIGGFSIFPLNKACQNKIERNNLYGNEILSADLVRNGRNPSAIYIAWVVGLGYKGKAMTLSYLKDKISDYLKSSDLLVYTRPSSEDGMRLVKLNNFVPIDKKDYVLNKIYKINGSQLNI